MLNVYHQNLPHTSPRTGPIEDSGSCITVTDNNPHLHISQRVVHRNVLSTDSENAHSTKTRGVNISANLQFKFRLSMYRLSQPS